MAVASGRPAGSLTRRRWALLLACVTSLVVVAVALGLLLRTLGRDRAEQAHRNAILRAARQFAVNFTTLDAKTLDQDIQRILDGATGAFRAQYAAGSSQITEVLKRDQSASTGEVLEAAILTEDDDSAQVLLVVDSTVTNAEAPQGAVRHFRIKMSLVREGGRWLAAELDSLS